MRPRTPSNTKNQKSSKKRASSAIRRKKEADNKDDLNQFNASDIDLFVSEPTKHPKEKLYICESAKKIAMIHAYQPKMLKQCLVSNPQSYKKFYNESEGLSMVSNLYTVSFMAHFREWKKSLRNRLFKIIALVIKLEIPASVNQTEEIVKELQTVTNELKFETDVVSKQKQVKMSNEASDLNKKFGQFRQYAQQLLQILNRFCSSVKRMSTIVEQVNNQGQSITSAKDQIEKISKQFQQTIRQSIYYCSTHTDSEFMNKAEYRILERFLSITQSYKVFLDNMAILEVFKHKLESLKTRRGKADEFTLEELEQIGKFINEKQSIDLKISKIDSEGKGTFKNQQTKQKLKTSVDRMMKQFLKQLEENFFLVLLQKECGTIKGETFTKSISNKGAQFLMAKKKLLRLTKIFTRYTSPQIYQMLSELLKQLSQNFQVIPELIQQIAERLQNKEKYSSVDSSEQIRKVKNLISKFEQSRDEIWEAISKIIKALGKRDLHEQMVVTKDSLAFDNVILKSSKKDVQFMRIFQLPPEKQKNVVQALDANIEHLESIMKDRLPSIKKILNQPSNLSNNETVAMFLVLTTQDTSNSDKVLSTIEILHEFYNNAYPLSQNKENADIVMNTLVSCFQSAVCKLRVSQEGPRLVEFLEWVVQQIIFRYLLANMAQTLPIIARQLTWLHQTANAGQDKEVATCREIINKFMTNKRSNPVLIKPNSLYSIYLTDTIAKIDQYFVKKDLYETYFRSFKTEDLWIFAKPLEEWSNSQFQYCIHRSQSAIVNKQRSAVNQLIENKIKKLQNIDQNKGKTKVSLEFIDQCKSKANSMSKLLPFTKTIANANTQTHHNVRTFIEVMREILNYLRNNQIFHIAIFCSNNDPLLFLCDEKVHDNFNLLLAEIEKKLKINSSEFDQNAQERFIPIDSSEGSKSKRSIYYKIKDISSLETLSNCMEAFNLEPEKIRKKLDYSVLSQLFEDGEPSQRLKIHLGEILDQLKKTNITQIFSGKNEKIPKVQQDLQHLIQSLSKSTKHGEDREKRISCLNQLLQGLGFSMKNILDKRGGSNRVFVCDYGDHGSYAYAILSEKDPARAQLSLDDQNATRIQKLFLESIFAMPYSRNRNLDEIKQAIRKVTNSGDEWASYLYGFDRHQLKNKAEIKAKIDKYVRDSSIKIQITNPMSINLSSYRIFLEECAKILRQNYPQQPLFKGVIDNNQREIICCSLDKNAISKLMVSEESSSGYMILPKNFRNAYIERSTDLLISVRLNQLVSDVLREIKSIEQFNPADLLISLSSVEALARFKKRIEKESSVKLAQEDHVDYVLNTLKVLGRDDPISKKAAQSSERLLKAQRLLDMFKESPFAIENLDVEPEDRTHFLEILDQHPTFQSKFGFKFSPSFLEKAHEFLNENGVRHKVFRYSEALIEITALEVKTEITLSKLFCVDDPCCLKYDEHDLEIKVEDITFEVEFLGHEEFNDPEITALLQSYYIGIKVGSSKGLRKQVANIRDKPFKVSCQHPRKPIQFSLIRQASNGQQEKVCLFRVINEYHYGCKYFMRTLQRQMVAICQQEKQTIAKLKQAKKEQEEEEKRVMGIDQREKVIRELRADNLHELFMDEDCICDISFTFSSGPDVDRDEIIARNPQFKFHELYL